MDQVDNHSYAVSAMNLRVGHASFIAWLVLPFLHLPVSAQSVLIPAGPGPDARGSFATVTSGMFNGASIRVEAAPPVANAVSSMNASEVKITDPSTNSSAAAVVLPLSRVQLVADDIARRAIGQSPARPSLFESVWRRARTKALEAIRLPASVRVGYLINSGAQSVKLGTNETLAATLLRAQHAGLRTNSAELQVLAAPTPPSNHPASANFQTSYNATVTKLATAIFDPAQANQDEFALSAAETQQAFIEDWPKLRNDPDARSEAVKIAHSV